MVEVEGDGESKEDEGVPEDAPVAQGCYSQKQIEELKTKFNLEGPSRGYDAVVPFPEDKIKALKPYGIILRKKENGTDSYYYFYLINANCVQAVKAHKITGDPLNGTAKTSNLWCELEKYNISSGWGSAR